MEEDPHVLEIARQLISDVGQKQAATLARTRAQHHAGLKQQDAEFWHRVAKAIEEHEKAN